jgi:hypothetical protein
MAGNARARQTELRNRGDILFHFQRARRKEVSEHSKLQADTVVVPLTVREFQEFFFETKDNARDN